MYDDIVFTSIPHASARVVNNSGRCILCAPEIISSPRRNEWLNNGNWRTPNKDVEPQEELKHRVCSELRNISIISRVIFHSSDVQNTTVLFYGQQMNLADKLLSPNANPELMN